MTKFLILFTSLSLLASCSLQKTAISQMEPIFDNSALALFEESDYEFARTALPGNLKLIEGLLKTDPENERLLLLAAQGYAGYALGFLEDEYPQRARLMYLRGRDFALRVLRADEAFAETEHGNLEAFQHAIAQMSKEDIPALFWAGFAWAGYINLSLTDPIAIADLARVQVMMDRVLQLQPDYFYGAVYLFVGTVYGMKPRMMGGDPEKAHEYFDLCIKQNDGKFLLAQVYAAQYYAAKTLNEEQFDAYLQQVKSAADDILPGAQLMNAIAKHKAEILNNKREELF